MPTRNRGYWYYARSFEGKEYGATCRVPIRSEDDWTPPQPDEDCVPDQPALPGEQPPSMVPHGALKGRDEGGPRPARDARRDAIHRGGPEGHGYARARLAC